MCAGVFVVAFFFFVLSVDKKESEMKSVAVLIGGETVQADIADTPEARTRGLSGRDSLGESHGMLFVFPENGRHSFWMKDMHFPIDIIWIAASGEVVHLEQEVSPDSFPAVFTPEREARYVLEVSSGFVEKHAIKIGDTVTLRF